MVHLCMIEGNGKGWVLMCEWITLSLSWLFTALCKSSALALHLARMGCTFTASTSTSARLLTRSSWLRALSTRMAGVIGLEGVLHAADSTILVQIGPGLDPELCYCDYNSGTCNCDVRPCGVRVQEVSEGRGRDGSEFCELKRDREGEGSVGVGVLSTTDVGEEPGSPGASEAMSWDVPGEQMHTGARRPSVVTCDLGSLQASTAGSSGYKTSRRASTVGIIGMGTGMGMGMGTVSANAARRPSAVASLMEP